MQKNTYYEDQPVYEEIELQNKAKPTDVKLKPSKRISSGNTDKINGSTSKNGTNLRGKCCLVVVLFPIAIAMVAAIALSAYALVSSNQGMGSLMKEIQELKMQLNETKEESETKIAKLKRYLTRIETDGLILQNSVDTANTTTMAKLGNLLSSVDTLNITDNNFMIEFNNIQSLVNSLTTVNEATTTQLNSLQSSVSSLTTRVNFPLLNLYQNCTQETTSCTIGPRSTDTYWTQCYTAYEPISKAGYYTTDIMCEYEAPTTVGIQETHILRKNGPRIQCQCHLSVLGGSQHAVIPSFVSTCSLVITRCPSY